MGSKALAAQPDTCFVQMLCVTKAPLSPFCLILGLPGGGSPTYWDYLGEGEKKSGNQRHCQDATPWCGFSRTCLKAGRQEVAGDVGEAAGSSFPSSTAAEVKLLLLPLLFSASFLTGIFSPASPSLRKPKICRCSRQEVLDPGWKSSCP